MGMCLSVRVCAQWKYFYVCLYVQVLQDEFGQDRFSKGQRGIRYYTKPGGAVPTIPKQKWPRPLFFSICCTHDKKGPITCFAEEKIGLFHRQILRATYYVRVCFFFRAQVKEDNLKGNWK